MTAKIQVEVADAIRMRRAFEDWTSDNGTHKRAIERGPAGHYILQKTHCDWTAWQAAWGAAKLETK